MLCSDNRWIFKFPKLDIKISHTVNPKSLACIPIFLHGIGKCFFQHIVVLLQFLKLADNLFPLIDFPIDIVDILLL